MTKPECMNTHKLQISFRMQPGRVLALVRTIGFCFIAIFLVIACSKNDITHDPACRLTFSVDTVQFDTVFTTIGSATKRLMVYNPNTKAIRTNITLAGAHSSPFRINIDGWAVENVRDIEIAAKDSIYIFVEVIIDPQNSDLPVIVNDSILFETNSNKQHVCLEAYAQDVFILRDQTIRSTTWSGSKPYLLYGRLVVDTLETLRIEAGVHVYLHQGADIQIKGSMVAEGETGNPVVFSGDRLEKMYQDFPGQWGSIVFGSASRDNVLRHVEIRNGTNGLVFGNPEYEQIPALTLDAVIITNMSYSGLMAFASDVEAVNCLITNCGYYTVGLFCGGMSRFVHCSIANNYSLYLRRKAIPALTISNSYAGSGTFFSEPVKVEGKIPGDVFLGNSIVYGSMSEELSIDDAISCLFDHCLLRTLLETTVPEFVDVIVDTDPMFVDPVAGDFRLDEESPARDAGDAAMDAKVPYDLDGNDRIIGPAPDLGAYEWMPE